MSNHTPLTELSAVEYIERLQGDAELVCTDDDCLSYPRRIDPNRPYSARLALEDPTCSECGSGLAVK
jgi:hypothetical protein